MVSATLSPLAAEVDDFNAQNGTHIVSASAVHVEPMGIYGGKQTSLDAIKTQE